MVEFSKAVTILRDSVRDHFKDLIAHLPNLAAGLLVVLITALIAWIARKILRRTVRGSKMRPSLKELIVTSVNVTVWIVGILVAAMIIFPGLTPAKALGAAGLASVAVGLAFKDIFQNFFAGILLLWRFPFEPGDFIECGDVMGKVVETRLRLTTIRRTSGELTIIPNAHLIGNPLDVITYRKLRRTIVKTGVAYKEDLERAIKVIRETIRGCSTIDTDQPIGVFASGFGSSSMDIDVIYWTDAHPYEMRRSRSEVVTSIKAALDREDIEIPFPYRTLTFDEPMRLARGNSTNSGADA